ncbi:unnamed protein product [Caenorhabditis nigoni]
MLLLYLGFIILLFFLLLQIRKCFSNAQKSGIFEENDLFKIPEDSGDSESFEDTEKLLKDREEQEKRLIECLKSIGFY